MSCDHRFIEENLHDFLEGRLAPELDRQCRQILDNCAQCAQVYEQANALYRIGDQWQDVEVPEWHRARYAVKPPVQNSHWMNWAAMAASLCAVVLVVFQMEVSTDDGLTISFGGRLSEQRMEQSLAEAIDTYRQEQDVQLTTFLAEYADQQEISNQLLLSEWSDQNRRERRDDLNFIMSAWEDQRYEDQRQYNRRFDTLANNQIESDQFVNTLARNVNFQQ